MPRIVVSAGPDYTTKEHVHVNLADESQCYKLESELAVVMVALRIQGYQSNEDPSTSAYFESPSHEQDLFSIQLSVIFKKDISGADLVFGNDFDEPIRNLLPWGYSTGLKIFKWMIDPSVEGDLGSDSPHLYGPALVTFNSIVENPDAVPVEDMKWPGVLNGDDIISAESSDVHSVAERKKYFMDPQHRAQLTFRAGHQYSFDLNTKYLSMGEEFKIKLPGFSYNVESYVGGQPLRYTLKAGDQVVVAVTLDLVKT